MVLCLPAEVLAAAIMPSVEPSTWLMVLARGRAAPDAAPAVPAALLATEFFRTLPPGPLTPVPLELSRLPRGLDDGVAVMCSFC